MRRDIGGVWEEAHWEVNNEGRLIGKYGVLLALIVWESLEE